MKRIVLILFIVGCVVAAIGLVITRPQRLPADALAGFTPDADHGKLVYAAMGCASCHMAPESDDQTRLPGGKAFLTDFGTFFAPNISSDPEHGIGDWTDEQIATAILRGTSPDNQHYFPVFPYGSYMRADPSDVADLIAHLRTLEPDQTPSRTHDVGFPFNIRASLGGWKLLFTDPEWVIAQDLTEQEERGRLLVEAMGHCGECHTPRNIFGGMKTDEWLAGAAIPGKKGRTPDLRAPSLGWSEADIVAYLKTGLTPEYDSAGGEMVDVIANTSQLPDSDLSAIAAYLLLIDAS
ncbi:cytochrome c [Aliiroseovarius sp. F47248L]|uniref:cytochrome c n=1 Tax=Aliiroseovarius sp. F47248L TaxID=2926420 RepID=UPI001FF5DEDE|nr:cytochrome c [Aliiroseovarius sp. F47248L]MCK0138418.1 cytochrome c [Aliiroseovarius sp. F47248L]